VGGVVTTRTNPAGKHADGVRNGGSPSLEWVKVIAAPSTTNEIEIVVVVADALPAKRGKSPPLLVAEMDLIGERIALTRHE
jgi:hypothetical protein